LTLGSLSRLLSDGPLTAWRFQAAAALADVAGASQRRTNTPPGSGNPTYAPALDNLSARARSLANPSAAASNPELASAALALLARDPASRDRDLDALRELLSPHVPAEVQSAAITALARAGGRKGADALLSGW